MLRVKFSDILRATLYEPCGNRGWLGFSPKGDQYHVVVPVDAQIARGVMACNVPTDGTPFGGYSGWLYYMCPPYDMESGDFSSEAHARNERARLTAEELPQWLASYQIDVEIVSESDLRSSEHKREEPILPLQGDFRDEKKPDKARVSCALCAGSWAGKGAFLRDLDVKLVLYCPCPDDFQRGMYIFQHCCGGMIRLPVSEFVRNRVQCRSLAGSHACPGLCYYESSWATCSADCEGSLYRRVAVKFRSFERA